MQKKNLIGERVVFWSSEFPWLKGKTATITPNIEECFQRFIEFQEENEITILFDGEEKGTIVNFSDLYFPNDPRGYNQPCFDL